MRSGLVFRGAFSVQNAEDILYANMDNSGRTMG
jgi:hypothetical protein